MEAERSEIPRHPGIYETLSKEEEEKEEFSHIEEGERKQEQVMGGGDRYNVYFHMWTISHIEAQTHRHTDTHACP